MQEILKALTELRTDLPWKNIFLGVIILVVGQLLVKIIDLFFDLIFKDITENPRAYNVRKFSIYFYNIILLLLFLKITGVDMKLILLSTGFLTLAIGFAARTPVSNLISGIFLVFERPFVVGDVIEVNDYKGEVISLNLLSLTMRTLDNLMVRIPNELVISTAVRNVSFFPIRRLEILYLLSNKESLSRLQEIFMETAERNELALDEPEPYFHVTKFTENAIEVSFLVWSSADDFFVFQSEFPQEIHRAVKKSGIDSIRTLVEVATPLGPVEKK